MLNPSELPITDFRDSFEPKTDYLLKDVSLIIVDERTARFSAKALGPAGETAWVRAWLSNEAEGTIAEAEVAEIPTGSDVVLTVVDEGDSIPEMACMRIESKEFETRHTVHTLFAQA